MTQRKFTFAVLALLAILAGCKGESPTSPTPPVTSTQSPTPVTGASVTLSVSNTSPVINSTSVITATVTQNNASVPNGTAVQFATTLGTFTDVGTAGTSVLKITTNGVATATLTSGSPGAAVVTATVNNVSKSATITFSSTPLTPPAPNTTPTITSITPKTGRPEGGETINIVGTNFRAPVRVIFTCEGDVATNNTAACNGQTTKDGFVVSVAPTLIVVLSPQFNVPAGSAISTSITVITQAGTPTEQPVIQAAAFTFTSATLTPVVRAVQPTSGPIGGGTRITIIGDAFQAPVQVFFNAAEAQVISITFNQIIVMSPRASDTAPTGSGTILGPVNVRVRNVASGTEVTYASGFRYTAGMTITTVNPTFGPVVGGTKVTIDGTGFDDPLQVVIGDVVAQVVRVSGTEVVAMTNPPLKPACANLDGKITVTNTENGDTASANTSFTFIVSPPVVVTAGGPVALGGTTTVVVLNAQGLPRITIGGVNATITATVVNADGTSSFTVQVPSTLKLDTTPCVNAAGVSAPAPTAFDVTYTSLSTGCTSTFDKGLVVTPAAAPVLTISGNFTPFVGTITPAQAGPPIVPASVAVSPPSETVTLVNTGTSPLIITSITAAGAGCGKFTPPPPPGTLNQCDTLPITASYNATTTPTATPDVCVFTITTNAGTRAIQLSGSAQ